MNFARYQKLSRQTAQYPKIGKPFIYPLLGLAGEAGEVVEKVKKVMRNKKGKIDKEFLKMIELELGDVLWYLANLATEFGLSLEKIAKKNLDKLFDRKKRDKIKGEGDLR
jgi:NTP pyrophosphatase (non-canonical NTP hydrolase)